MHCGAINVRVVLLKIMWVLTRILRILHVVFHVPLHSSLSVPILTTHNSQKITKRSAAVVTSARSYCDNVATGVYWFVPVL